MDLTQLSQVGTAPTRIHHDFISLPESRASQQTRWGLLYFLHLGCSDLVMNLSEGLLVRGSDDVGNVLRVSSYVTLNLRRHVHFIIVKAMRWYATVGPLMASRNTSFIATTLSELAFLREPLSHMTIAFQYS
jgi:hypothetical protein